LGSRIAKLMLIALSSGAAFAAPIHWTLNGVTFADGGTASGGFTYDATTNTYSAINITTTTVGTFTGHTYVAVHPAFSAATAAVTLTTSSFTTGTPFFFLTYNTPLSNAGGTVTLTTGSDPGFDSSEGLCSNAGCTGPAPPTRLVTAGSLVGTSTVPPATVPTLSGSGLALIGILLAIAGAWLMRAPQPRTE
jgi:hypothetical protein